MSRSNKKRLGIISEAAGTYPQKPYSTRQKKLIESIKFDDNIDVAFESAPIVSAVDVAGAAYAGGDAKTVPMWIDGEFFQQTNIGIKTILSPLQTATGLNVALDQVDNEGCEINNGILSNSPAAYVVGAGYDYVAECTVNIADVSGSDDCIFGVRKAEAHQAALDDYDEMAGLNVISGSVKAETILNGGATSTSSALATVADGVDVTLRVVVRNSGKCEFSVDGTLASSVSFTFDSGEVIVPFFQFLHATTSPGDVILSAWKAGRY
jgi:hypothetical protein